MVIRIGTVVFDAPGATLDQYDRSAGGIARLYAELLGMRLLSRSAWYREQGWEGGDDGDEVDPLVFAVDGRGPNIAFECETGEYHAPAWPDPDRPQQVHVDVAVPNLTAAEEIVLRYGGVRLAGGDDGHDQHRVYADGVGHPFCLYFDADVDTPRIGRIVFDCFSPRAVARFWSELMDMPVRVLDTAERVEIARADGNRPNLAFQHSLAPMPRWPDPARPQQIHLDLAADDEAAAQAHAVDLGAMRLPYLGGGVVFADPAGHPFCLGDG